MTLGYSDRKKQELSAFLSALLQDSAGTVQKVRCFLRYTEFLLYTAMVMRRMQCPSNRDIGALQ